MPWLSKDAYAEAVPGVEVEWSTGLVYTGSDQVLATLTGAVPEDVIEWKVDGNKVDAPKAETVGEHSVSLSLRRDGYDEFVRNSNVTIGKQPQTLSFNNYTAGGSSDVTVDGKACPYEDVTYDFSATGTVTGNINYSIDITDEDIAKIDENGTLHVYEPVKVHVTAAFAETGTATGASIGYDLTVKGQAKAEGNSFIKFQSETITASRTFGSRDLCEQKVTKLAKGDNGTITYSLKNTNDEDVNYADVDNNGKVTITNKILFNRAVRKAEGEAFLKVTAAITESGLFSSDTASYLIKIGESDDVFKFESGAFYIESENFETDDKVKFEIVIGTKEIPATTIKNIKKEDVFSTIDVMKENLNKLNDLLNDKSNWEKVEESDYYRFRIDATKKVGEKYVYPDGIYNLVLKYSDKDTAEEGLQCNGEFTIDNTASELYGKDVEGKDPAIDYKDGFFQRIVNKVFNGDKVTVKLTAYDYTSGVKSFDFSFKDKDGITKKITLSGNDILQDETDKTKFTAEVKVPQSVIDRLDNNYSNISIDKVVDKAGNELKGTTEGAPAYVDEGVLVVVDNVKPIVSVEYTNEPSKVGDTYYYGLKNDNKITANIKIKETNFDKADFAHNPLTIVAKNDIGDDITFNPNELTWSKDADGNHIAELTINQQGEYKFNITYTDLAGNSINGKDEGGSEIPYVSDRSILDTTSPLLDVVYDPASTAKKGSYDNRDYYQSNTRTATVKITEHYFKAEDVQFVIGAKDAARNDITLETGDVTYGNWSTEGDVHTRVITFNKEANYDFYVEYKDFAQNVLVKSDGGEYTKEADTEHFAIDKTIPVVEKVAYSDPVDSREQNLLESIKELFGYYQDKAVITVTATDAIAGIHSFTYSYTLADGVSTVNKGTESPITVTEGEPGFEYVGEGKARAKLKFEIPKEALGPDNQFNGHITVTVNDRSENISDEWTDKSGEKIRRTVVDNISPVGSLSFNKPVKSEGRKDYYGGDINATLKINEANFYKEDVNIAVTKDGKAYKPSVSWTDADTDNHTGTFTLTSDGDYEITVSYKDRSNNEMKTITSRILVIDTFIENPTFTINGASRVGQNGGSYGGNCNVGYSFKDKNFESYTAELTHVGASSTDNATGKYVNVARNSQGGSGSFSVANQSKEDGIYTLKITMTDKIGHHSESFVTFTVDRFGSVYKYSDYLMSLIKDGGQFVTKNGKNDAITRDIVITEYNPTNLVDNAQIIITRDGEMIKNPICTTTASVGGTVRWSEYRHVISKSNFRKDGVYKISIVSKDAVGNESKSLPENSFYDESKEVKDEMKFTVDTKKPSIRNISNLEKKIINAAKVDVDYDIVDEGGIKSVKVYIDGKCKSDIRGKEIKDVNNYKGMFTLHESGAPQKVRIVVADRAGNVTDTSSESFDTKDMYEFNDTVVVSTNLFVRWFRNTPLFVGTLVVLIGGVAFIISRRRKDDENDVAA